MGYTLKNLTHPFFLFKMINHLDDDSYMCKPRHAGRSLGMTFAYFWAKSNNFEGGESPLCGYIFPGEEQALCIVRCIWKLATNRWKHWEESRVYPTKDGSWWTSILYLFRGLVVEISTEQLCQLIRYSRVPRKLDTFSSSIRVWVLYCMGSREPRQRSDA